MNELSKDITDCIKAYGSASFATICDALHLTPDQVQYDLGMLVHNGIIYRSRANGINIYTLASELNHASPNP